MPAVDERARHDLFEAVHANLGPRQADTLMSLLPPVGWTDVATKHDLHELECRLDAMAERFSSVDVHLDAHDQRFTTIDRRFDTVERRFDAVDRRFDAVDVRFTDMDKRFDRLEESCATRSELDTKLDALEHRVLAALHESQSQLLRTLLLGLIGVSTAMASVSIAAMTMVT